MRPLPAQPRAFLRWALRLLLVAGLCALAVGLIRWQTTLNWAGSYLVSSQRPKPSDLILVMGGDFWGPRVVKAAELGRQGLAPLVLISGPPYRDRPEGEFAVDFLVKQGYPRDLFAVFGHHEASTLGEVLALRGELKKRGVKQVIVVTSEYHSRRCALLFRLFCPGIHFISAPAADSHYHPVGWWKDLSSRRLFFSEWSKILGSLLVAYPVYRIRHWTVVMTQP
jgi:uncharacterized SAM-binding protein YcdF (DUF218 family)